MINKILKIFAFLLLAINLQAQIRLIGKATTQAVGSGSSGIPSAFTYDIPAGKNRVMIVQMWFERDHRPSPMADNYPSANYGTPAPNINIGLKTIAPSFTYRSYFGDAGVNDRADTAEITSILSSYALNDASGLPTGPTIIDFSAIQIPKSAADEVMVTIEVYENVSASTDYSLYQSTQFFSNTGTNSASGTTAGVSTFTVSVPTAAALLPPGTTADEIAYLGIGAFSEEGSTRSVNSGWTPVNNWSVANTVGSNFSYSLSPVNEPDGISMITAFSTGSVLPPSFAVTRSTNDRILIARNRVFAMLPAARPRVSGSVYNDLDGSTNIGGVPTNAGGSYINVVDPITKLVVATTTVAADGSYTIPAGFLVEGTTYQFQLSKNKGTVGFEAPAIILNGYNNVGEDLDASGNDGNADGILSITIGSANISNTRFGVFQPAFIYVHKKSASELGSPGFNFTMTPNSGALSSFVLNDTPVAVNVSDLGASHGNGEGQLWAIGLASFSATTHLAGNIYTRKPGESTWTQVGSVANARSIDGIGLDSAVYSDSNGDVFILKNGVSTKIYSRTSATTYAVDVASDGTESGIVAVIGANFGASTTTPIAMQNRKLFKYDGTGTTWTEYANAGNKVYRVDMLPSSSEPYFINFAVEADADMNVYKMSSGSATTATSNTIAGPANGFLVAGQPGAAYNNRRDIAVSGDGSIFSLYSISGAPSDALYLMERIGGTWNFNAQSRNVAAPTGGPGNQVWAVTKANATIVEHAIFTRASNGDWLDDERVRTGTEGNSIMIPVPAGTYTINEAVAANYKLSEIVVIDPTDNSSSSIASGSASINVVAGEVVHVTFQNTKLNSIPVPGNCTENILMDFGQGAADFGPPLDGITAYHYKQPGINGSAVSSTGDGYYSLTKKSSDFFSGLNTNLTNHTPGQPDGYFAIFNASYAKDDFFRRTLTGMIPGTQYRLSFWAANLTPNNVLKPNAIMSIVDNSGVSMGQVATGDITGTDWKIYTFTFTATSATGEIFLRNNGVGGSGNDIALDDISISASPVIIPPIVGSATVCGANAIYQFTNPTTGGTWSSDNVSLLTIDPNTGLATVNANGLTGVVNLTYTYTNPSTGCNSYAFTAVNVITGCDALDAVNDINLTPINTLVTGDVKTNDESSNGTENIQSAQYYNSAGVLTNLPLGTSTQVYTSTGTLAGNMTLNADGTYTFTPATGFIGDVPVNYTANNGAGLIDTAILTIQVIPASNIILNDKPIAQDDTAFTKEGVPVTSKALANDSDPDGNTLSITNGTQGATVITIGGPAITVSGTDASGNAVANAGTLTIASNGTYVFTPAAGFIGNVNPISYTISDGNGETDTANIYITVDKAFVNHTYANDDANTASKGVEMNGNVKTNDTDPESNTQTVTAATFGGTALTIGTATTIPGVGSITLNADGTYKFTPTATFVGTTSVVYTICDNGTPQSCDQATLYLTSLDVTNVDICTNPNVIYSLGAVGIVPVDVVAGTTGTAFAIPSAGSSPNGLGYSVISKKFYYFEKSNGNNPLVFVSFDPATNVKSNLAIPYTTLAQKGTTPRGVVSSDGSGYYMLNEGVELYYYNIAANTWTFITKTFVDQNGNEPAVLTAPEVSGDIAIDGQNNLWILSSAYGGSATPATHSLYKVSAPLPTAAVASLSIALLKQSGINPNNETFTGIAFNATGQIFLGSPQRIYRLNNDFTITQLANVSGLSDLASCSLPITAFPQDITGNVYNDINGLGGTPANTIDGAGTNIGGLNAVLIDRTNNLVIATIPVNANGTYSFPQTSAGIYTIEITTATATVGSTAPAVVLPINWVNIGENIGSGPGTDGTADGKLNIDINGAPVSNANFGIALGYCYKLPATNSGVTVPTKHGITALNRAGADNGNWPMVRQSSWTTLEAKTKGFVVNRVSFDASGNPVGIATANYVEGMMVYDITNNCLKIYNGTAWSCYSTPACP